MYGEEAGEYERKHGNVQSIHSRHERTRGRGVGLERRAEGAGDTRAGQRLDRFLVGPQHGAGECEPEEQCEQEHPAPPEALARLPEPPVPEHGREVGEDEHERRGGAPDVSRRGAR